MRTEAEMMALILGVARADERVRAVVLNGSRANPRAPKDLFQDYDIVYAVRDLPSFVSDPGWIDVFGPRVMLQTPETMRQPLGDGRFTWLMLLCDGNRIDLTLLPAERFSQLDARESASVLLLDKDGAVMPYPPAGDESYHVRPPDELHYSSCCNNFWWCAQNVAKGIWRDEVPYAKAMQEEVLRPELLDMAGWVVGVRRGFCVSVGKWGKYLKDMLPKEDYTTLLETYSSAGSETMWQSLLAMCGLFDAWGREVGQHFGYAYPQEDADAMLAYLHTVRRLPPTATQWPG